MSVPGVSMVGGVFGTAESMIRRRDTRDPTVPPGMTMWFNVWVSELDQDQPAVPLGTWSGCSGLEVQLTPDGPFDEGGNYLVPRYLPGKISYPKVTLERAMTYDGAARVRNWLERQAREWVDGRDADGLGRATVVVELFSGLGKGDQLIHRWELKEAIAVGWTVPQFSTSGSGGIALEKLTLVHGGFLTGVEHNPSKLELIDKADPKSALSFEYNPAQISLSRKREVDTGRSTIDTTTVLVDPNAVSITLTGLRLEGRKMIEEAVPKLRRWIELHADEGQSARPRQAPARAPEPATPGTREPCEKCGRLAPSPEDASAAGSLVVLKMVWGAGGGGLPKEMLLKGFDLDYTRFTGTGEPSRATVKLTLQEYKDGSSAAGTGRVKIGAYGGGSDSRGGSAASGSGRSAGRQA